MKPKKIMEPYFKQIEAGVIPTFDALMGRYTEIISKAPASNIEMACIASLLIVMYPDKFGKAIEIELKRRGFTPNIF